jgi:hypothetical protein
MRWCFDVDALTLSLTELLGDEQLEKEQVDLSVRPRRHLSCVWLSSTPTPVGWRMAEGAFARPSTRTQEAQNHDCQRKMAMDSIRLRFRRLGSSSPIWLLICVDDSHIAVSSWTQDFVAFRSRRACPLGCTTGITHSVSERHYRVLQTLISSPPPLVLQLWLQQRLS